MRLTPNKRMAAYINAHSNAKTSFEAISFDSWINNLWSELKARNPSLPNLISSNAQEFIWEKIITHSKFGEKLINTRIVKKALEAWNLIQNGLIELDGSFSTLEASFFLEWAKTYEEHCLKNNYIDSSCLIKKMIVELSKNPINLHSKIEMIGFMDLSRAQKKLLDFLQQQNVEIKNYSLVTEKKMPKQIGFDNFDQELLFCIQSVKAWYQENPNGRYAIVFPNLSQEKYKIQRMLKHCLDPNLYSLAAPMALDEYHSIASAFSLVQWIGYIIKDDIPLEAISRLLRDQGAKENPEWIASHSIDKYLYDYGEKSFKASHLLFVLNEINNKIQPLKVTEFINKLSTLINNKKNYYAKEPVSFFLNLFTETLNLFNWTIEESDENLTTDLKNQWDELLKEYLELENLLGSLSFFESLTILKKLARKKLYFPQNSQSPIQVLGLLESCGIPFDGIWIASMHQMNWPILPDPNPFIPMTLQHKYNLPHSTIAREYQIAKNMTNMFAKGAEKIIFSYFSTFEDESIDASSLIKEFPILNLEQDGLNETVQYKDNYSYFKQRLNNTKFSKGEDFIYTLNQQEYGPPIINLDHPIKSGTRALTLQSACPFRAFSEIRLKAEPFNQIIEGFSPQVRGEMVHQVLFHFWRRFKSQAEVLKLSVEELNEAIKNAVEHTLDIWQKRFPKILTAEFRELESIRHSELLSKVIELEKKRSPFEVISIELSDIVKVGDLKFKIRIDRMDKLENNHKILLDYKTGSPSLSDWFGERPNDPQLPIYCITRADRPVGMAFLIIKSQQVKYLGLSDDETLLPGIKEPMKVMRYGSEENFKAQCDVWQLKLENLAHEFQQGKAFVDPRDGASTCRNCALSIFCRVE